MITKCNLRTIYQLINEQGLLYIHKIQATKKPLSIYEFYNTNNKNTRPKLNLRPKYKPKTTLLKNSLFFKYTELYIEKFDPFSIANTEDNDNTSDSE